MTWRAVWSVAGPTRLLGYELVDAGGASFAFLERYFCYPDRATRYRARGLLDNVIYDGESESTAADACVRSAHTPLRASA